MRLPPVSRCLWPLLLASACAAAPERGPTHDYVLKPSGNAGSTTATQLQQKDLGEVPALAYPPPPPLPPDLPGAPKNPFDSAYWPADYSDPNYVLPNATTMCEPAEIEHSNRTGAAQCMDRLTPFPVEGTECFYECEPGYIALGRHVCQWHDFDWIENNSHHTDPQHNERGWLAAPSHKRAFYGGRCQKLCGELTDQTCPGSQSARRFPKSMMTSEISDEDAGADHAQEHDASETAAEHAAHTVGPSPKPRPNPNPDPSLDPHPHPHPRPHPHPHP